MNSTEKSLISAALDMAESFEALLEGLAKDGNAISGFVDSYNNLIAFRAMKLTYLFGKMSGSCERCGEFLETLDGAKHCPVCDKEFTP